MLKFSQMTLNDFNSTLNFKSNKHEPNKKDTNRKKSVW